MVMRWVRDGGPHVYKSALNGGRESSDAGKMLQEIGEGSGCGKLPVVVFAAGGYISIRRMDVVGDRRVALL